MQLADFDIALLRILNRAFSPQISLFFVFVLYSLYAFVLLLIFYFWKNKQTKKLTHFIIVLIAGLLLVYFLKYLVARPRPYESYPDIKAGMVKTDSSFPSSHAFASFLCLYFLSRWSKRTNFFEFVLLVFYLAILIPVGSLYIGVHYPSDVIVSAAIGILLPIFVSEKIALKVIKKVSSYF